MHYRAFFTFSAVLLCLSAGCFKPGVRVNWRGETPRQQMEREQREQGQARAEVGSDGKPRDRLDNEQEISDQYTEGKEGDPLRRRAFYVRVAKHAKQGEAAPEATARYVEVTTDVDGKKTARFKEDRLRWTGARWRAAETRDLPAPSVTPSRFLRNGKALLNVAALVNRSPQAVAKVLGPSKAYETRMRYGRGGKASLAAEICTYGNKDDEPVTVWYVKKKARRIILRLHAGVVPHALTSQEVAAAFGIQKLTAWHSGSKDGPVDSYSADIAPFEGVLFAPYTGGDGIDYNQIDFTMPGVPQ